MKKYFSIFGVFIILNSSFLIHNCQCQWMQQSCSGHVLSLKTKNNIIFAGSSNGVFYTTNYGINWIQTNLNNHQVEDLVLKDSMIIAGTSDSGIYLSLDYGETWIHTSLNNCHAECIVIKDNHIFVGTYVYGVYRSDDNGYNWSLTGLTGQIEEMAVIGNNIFAGKMGVYKSTNDGINWTATNLPPNRYIYSFATAENILYAGTYGQGVYFTTNYGDTWVQTSLNSGAIFGLYAYQNYILAGMSSSGVFISTNNGFNWIEKNQGFPSSYSVTPCSFIIVDNYVFAGTWWYSVWRRLFSELTNINNLSAVSTVKYVLEQNYPNPFNQSSIINFKCSVGGMIQIKVFDLSGKEVTILVNEYKSAGNYSVDFNSKDLPSGIYFYRMQVGKFIVTKKLIILK